MSIDHIVNWMKNALDGLTHGQVMVAINVTDGKIVFVRKRKEETEKSIDTKEVKEYSLDN